VETTGIANPAPVAQTFHVEEALKAKANPKRRVLYQSFVLQSMKRVYMEFIHHH